MKLEGSIEDLLDSGILELQITGFFLKSDLELGDDLVFKSGTMATALF